MSVTAIRGEQYLIRRGYARALREGQTVNIPAFERVDLQLAGGIFLPSVCRLQLCIPAPHESGQREGTRTVDVQCGDVQLRHVISEGVFQNPQREWSATAMAGALQMTRNKIRTMLFRQGDALTQLCRTQRLMRALFDSLLCDLEVSDLKVRLGWPDTSDLEASFQDWFGVSLQTVSRLREDSVGLA